MQQLTTIAELRRELAARRAAGASVGFVPTMGALHEGHLALVAAAARHADVVVVSIFVNPTQFDRADDLQAYPRDLAGDLAALAALPTPPAIVFCPSVEELYPRPARTRVHVEGLTDGLCGARRPGHFDGVATVVTKLLSIVAPDVAVFGRKDRQQLEVVRTLVADLDLPVTVLGVPTVRDPDGLARSSRNQRLSQSARQRALALPRALAAAVAVGPRPQAARAAAAQVLDAAAVDVEYLEVVDPVTLAPLATLAPPPPGDQAISSTPDAPVVPSGSSTPDAPAEQPTGPDRLLVAVAAFVDGVRLIDNVEVGDAEDEAGLRALL